MRALLKGVVRGVGVVVLILILIAVGIISRWYGGYEFRAAQYDLSALSVVPEKSAIYDVHRTLYSHIQGVNRLSVPLDQVSPYFVQALLAREDTEFWNHHGVVFSAMARAAVANHFAGRIRQGASTLTQQLVRDRMHLAGRTYDRKILEVLLAFRVERQYSKRQILDLYMNQVYFGHGHYGIETAARGYFSKPASELTLAESAMLAGLIRSPNHLAPTRDLEAASEAQNAVLKRMQECAMITPEQAEAAKAERLHISAKTGFQFEENYAVDAIKDELQQVLSEERIEVGGLRVFTSIDANLQQSAELALEENIHDVESRPDVSMPQKAAFKRYTETGKERLTDYLQGALVMIDNASGGIRAIVGGRDYKDSSFSRATEGKRQLGSTFKPFVYATAFQNGLRPQTLVNDGPLAPGELKGLSPGWSPHNSDGEFFGLEPAGFGLVHSRNTMTVRVGMAAGLKGVKKLAMQAGIGDAMPLYPSALLGSFETSLKNLTAAYTIFPNNGVLRTAHFITRVEDSDGNVVFSRKMESRQILEPRMAWTVSSLLQQVMKVGTAAKSRKLGWEQVSGGKTGTTNDFQDAWFIGYTSSLTCGVWVGFDRPRTIMPKGYGAELALPVWVSLMSRITGPDSYPALAFLPPGAVRTVSICEESGGLATRICKLKKCAFEATLPDNLVPHDFCPIHPDAVRTASSGVTLDTAEENGVAAVTPKNGGFSRPAAVTSINTIGTLPAGERRVVVSRVTPTGRGVNPPPIAQRIGRPGLPRTVARRPIPAKVQLTKIDYAKQQRLLLEAARSAQMGLR